MRKSLRGLILSRETLHRLATAKLATVAGGFSIPAYTCGDSNQTCDLCPTYSCHVQGGLLCD